MNRVGRSEMAKFQYCRTKEDLVAGYHAQRMALSASAKSYDEGNLWEAGRLATTVSTLVHDGIENSRTKSLLLQLQVKGKIRYISSCPAERPGRQSISMPNPLCGLAGGDTEPRLVPMLEKALTRREVQFHEWWNENIWPTPSGPPFSRKNLVHFLRSQDGAPTLTLTLPTERTSA